MKIESSVKSVGGPPSGETRARATGSSAQPAQAPADKVELSSLSSSLNRAEAAMERSPVVNRARVEEIRQAISEGRLKVDAGRIADGLIDSVRDMLVVQGRRS